MKIPVKEVLLLDGSSNYVAIEKPSPVIRKPYSLDQALSGEPQPDPGPEPVDYTPTDFCCKRMEVHYHHMNYSNALLRISTKLGKPVVAIVHRYEEWGETTTDDVAIERCPFCGQGFDMEIVKTVKMVRRDVVTQVSIFEEEPLS